MHQIMIIGTVPPCPRCRLLTELVTEIVRIKGIDAQVRHIAYTDKEAEVLAADMGLVPGTAKDVARILEEDVALDKMPKASECPAPAFMNRLHPEFAKFGQLFREVNILDNWLRTFEDRAKEAGILMTPVLVMDGKVKHNGSVPEPDVIQNWLLQLK